MRKKVPSNCSTKSLFPCCPNQFSPPPPRALGRNWLAGLLAGLLCCLAQGALAQSISGPTEVCRNTPETYFYNGSCPFASWQVTGGTILAQSAASVTVQWGAGGNGRVRYLPSDRNCLEPSLAVFVIIPPCDMGAFWESGNTFRMVASCTNVTDPSKFDWQFSGPTQILSTVKSGNQIWVTYASFPQLHLDRYCVYTLPIDCQTGNRINNFCASVIQF
jgi:hypothetical protein